MEQTLYDRLGGEAAVMAAVDLFYRKVVADPVTSPFFDHLDMPGQVKKQVAFMTTAFGGPPQYRGRDLRSAHAALVRDRGLGDVHFDAVAGHLAATLRELGVAPELVNETLELVASTRRDVLGR